MDPAVIVSSRYISGMADLGSDPDALTARREVASRMAEAARTSLDTLDPEQLSIGRGVVPGDDPTDNERRRWFYTPTDHGGLTIHQQRPAQQRAAMRLISTGLSPAAYVTVATIMGLENVLDYNEGFVVRFDRERGRDPGLYYLRVFGEPGNQGLWGWRFGGHHISLNNLVVDGVLAATTPCFLGADPATSPLLGGAVNRPLARVEDLGRELVRSLRPELAARTILLPRAPSDFVTANRTLLTDGDRVIPLVGVWRDERFPDPVEQAKLQKLSYAPSYASIRSERYRSRGPVVLHRPKGSLLPGEISLVECDLQSVGNRFPLAGGGSRLIRPVAFLLPSRGRAPQSTGGPATDRRASTPNDRVSSPPLDARCHGTCRSVRGETCARWFRRPSPERARHTAPQPTGKQAWDSFDPVPMRLSPDAYPDYLSRGVFPGLRSDILRFGLIAGGHLAAVEVIRSCSDPAI